LVRNFKFLLRERLKMVNLNKRDRLFRH
jgi:hypothetical protein